MSEKTINVARAFTVIVDPDGQGNRPVTVQAGVQKVPAVIADHWYTQLHLVQGGFGTAEYAQAARAAADNAFHEADAAVKKYEGLEQAVRDAEDEAGLERSEPAHIRLRAREEGDAEVEAETPVAPAATVTAPDAASATLQGGAGDDSILGGQGNDTITGGDTAVGGQGSDSLSGDGSQDTLTGGQSADTLQGGQADDGETGGPAPEAPATETPAAAPKAKK